jgi:hypothetical protein
MFYNNFFIGHAKVDGITVSLWAFVTKMVIIQVPLKKDFFDHSCNSGFVDDLLVCI